MGEKGYIQSLAEFIKAIDELTKAYNDLKKEVERLSKELYRQKNLLNSILESISEGVIAIDNSKNILSSNKFAQEFIELGILELIDLNKPEDEIKLKDRYLKITVYPLLLKDEKIGRVIVIRDVTREKRLEEENKRRERLSAMGEIAVTLAHEIRNPLGSIELFAGLLRRSLEGENKKLVEAIISVTHSINQRVSNILLFTKDLSVSNETINIKEIVDEVMESLRHLLLKKRVNLKIEGKDDVILTGSRELIGICLNNLMTNAIEAVDENGNIEVGWKERDNSVEIYIKDDGKGIPEELKKEIFKPFFTTKSGGTGIGLSIVNRIVEAHGGHIEFSSKKGETLFRLIFPLSKDTP